MIFFDCCCTDIFNREWLESSSAHDRKQMKTKRSIMAFVFSSSTFERKCVPRETRNNNKARSQSKWIIFSTFSPLHVARKLRVLAFPDSHDFEFSNTKTPEERSSLSCCSKCYQCWYESFLSGETKLWNVILRNVREPCAWFLLPWLNTQSGGRLECDVTKNLLGNFNRKVFGDYDIKLTFRLERRKTNYLLCLHTVNGFPDNFALMNEKSTWKVILEKMFMFMPLLCVRRANEARRWRL